MLTRESFTGPWAGLPVAWTADDEFDETTYRADVARSCEAGVPGVYTAGTTGEFYAQEFDEFQRIARATVEECHARGKPAMIGCTSTYTRGAVRRAEFAANIGADAVQVALPFWMEVADDQVVLFFRAVGQAAGSALLSVYETTRTKKTLSLDQHRAIRDAAPNYVMVKSNASTLGVTEDGCRALSEFVNVFVGEHLWAKLGPLGAKGCCSSAVYWNPRIILELWQQVAAKNWPVAEATCARLGPLYTFLFEQFGPRGFTDSAYDRLGGLAGGFLRTSLRCRAPYPHAVPADLDTLRAWYRAHWPEMLSV